MTGVKGRSGGSRPGTGGARPGAGRPRKAVVPAVVPPAQCDDPLDFLQAVMESATVDTRLRIMAARILLSFTTIRKARLAKRDAAADSAAKAARGKFKPSAPPARVVDINQGRKP